jgi:monoamine oxidase
MTVQSSAAPAAPSRRALLQGGLPLLAAGLPLPACGQGAPQARIAVIGAGIAGLACGQVLAQAGASVEVLEASDRIGGRIHTERSWGVPVEMGAAWIHGPQGNPVSELASATQARLVETDFLSLSVRLADGSQAPNAGVRAAHARFEALTGAIGGRPGSWSGRSVEDVIRREDPAALRDPLVRWFLSAWLEFDAGRSVRTLSADLIGSDEGFDGPDLLVASGYDRLLAPVRQGLEIRRGVAVRAVVPVRGGLDVETVAGGRERYDGVVCAVPLGVVQGGSLRLPVEAGHPVEGALQRMKMGAVTKLALRFDRPVADPALQFLGRTDPVMGRWPMAMNHAPFTGPEQAATTVLTLFSFADHAASLEQGDPQALVSDGLEALRDLLGSAAPAPWAHLVAAWSRNPLAGGAYSTAPVEVRRADFDAFLQSLPVPLVFAGEHVGFDYYGTVHGALLSGRAAARRLLEQLGN